MNNQDPGQNRSLLLWGSLALSFDAASFEHLRKTVLGNDDITWLADALKSLPQACETALSALPSLHRPTWSYTIKHLADLNEAFATGRPLDAALPLPNTLLIPLVVVAQLAQYAELMRQTSPADGDESVRIYNGEALGLCTGLLGAFAASSAHNMDELRRYGANAVRLGLLVGLAVDGQDEASASGRSRSLSVAWSSAEGHREMIRIVKDSPDAYVSVHYDENRVTITSSADSISDLARRLQAAGIAATEISLFGRFHVQSNSTLVQELVAFCDSHPDFQLPDASLLKIPARANDSTASLLSDGPLHAHALRSILVEPPSWYEAFTAAVQANSKNGQVVEVLDFGPERSVPLSLAAKGSLKMRVVHLADHATTARTDRRSERMWLDSDIAVVGMSCKVPGANSVDEFWDLLVAGRSQHREISPVASKSSSDRFTFEDSPFRTSADANMDRKWFANLVDGHDQFDHRFFKKSPRESAAMDPQQRHILQVAYQAVEQSGYFQRREKTGGADARRIGCFVGVCLGDYDNNVACHAANAFTATGNLQGFISGKVSHFFGWTGPGLTINTACSSSLVAVHQACHSILAGECEAALAGGSHIMTSAEWFQNLAAGSFLSPTGQCKPFDAKADGYCRGEGVGAVFLKKMSKALADGDPILGVVAATGVQQNENCTPIFVPNTPSLGDLFTRVMTKAKVRPSQISVVEAHGTGTAVGDPAEYDSIRKALGGSKRGSGKQLMISSVKGLVGHMECTSGVISLIKVLLMMNKGVLPPQASFDTVNPALKTSPADQMFIPTRAQPWDADFRAALINNYGASGSNASAVILQAPSPVRRHDETAAVVPTGAKYPFWLSGFDDKALRRYVRALRHYLGRSTSDASLANLSFNLARQSNRTLDHSMIFTASSFEEVDRNLAAFNEPSNSTNASSGHPASSVSPKVIMCFGGQISSYIGLDPQLYQSVAVLRKHLDRVDAVVQSLGCPSIFPGIFQRSPVSDTVQLQVMLLATQYACARSWMDSGVQPAALVGHSFGELTALCISQILSLEETVKIIVRRASLVRDDWGSDRGAMMAVEGDLRDVQAVLTDINKSHPDKPANIACYNGPRSFTLAGTAAAIDAVAAELENRRIKAKRLNVTNAFHSVLVDSIYDGLQQSARGLTFRKPVIPLELATEESTSETELTARFVADHMRNPVYFHHAVERLARRHSASPCVFLEAGTNSTITSMAARALINIKATLSFHAVNVANCEDGWNRLTDTTVSLWKAGLRVQHWAHHGLHRDHQADIKPLLLPPYQFDPDSRHWMELKTPPKALPAATGDENTKGSAAEDQPEGLLAFTGYQDGTAQRRALFRVNTMAERYKQLLSGHVTMRTAPILSATLQIGLVIDAIGMLHPEHRPSAQLQPQIQDVEYKSPVCANSARTTWIEISTDAPGVAEWQFEVFSTANGCQKQKRMMHTVGRVALQDPSDPSLQRQLLRFSRLFGHGRALGLLHSADVAEALGNRSLYRLFSEIVDYGDEFRGLQKMVVRGSETAGRVVRLNQDPDLFFDPHLADTFCQLGGLWINCMTDRARSDVFLANGIDQWIRAHPATKRPDEFHAFSVNHRPSDQLCLTDVFVFDAADGALIEVILGIAYVKIPKSSMEKLLASLTEPSWMAKTSASVSPPVSAPAAASFSSVGNGHPAQQAPTVQSDTQPKTRAAEPRPQKQGEQQALQDLTLKVKAIIADLSGLAVDEIGDSSQLADLGIDSLVGMEMVNEIESTLKVKLPQADILTLIDMPSLMACVAGAMGISTQAHAEAAEDGSNDDSDRDTLSSMSPSDSGTTLSTPAPESDIKEQSGELTLPFATVMEAFNETKQLTDTRVAEMGQTSYVAQALPLQNELTVALTIEAFETLGAGLEAAQPGTQLSRIPHGKEHDRFVTYLYEMLEAETQIIKLDGTTITRTAVPLPQRHSKELYEELLRDHPDQACAAQLTHYAGVNLPRVLSGATDGVKLIFGSAEGRDLVSRWYAEWPLNRVLIAQAEHFFTRLCAKLPRLSEARPLRILEMGAGTGGTTKRMVPLLARLGVPVEYTFTDLAPSFVAAARAKWGKEYPWMRFRAHDIEKAPAPELEGTQHFVIASNAVHATRSLCVSAGNVRKALRPDGFLVMVEMTRTPYWVDLIFGLFEGWWLFDDGRRHALTHESRWQSDLQAAGYGHVDWTDGDRPECEIQKVIIASADSTSRYERLPHPSSTLPEYHPSKVGASDDCPTSDDCVAREEVVAQYVRELTQGFDEALTRPATGIARRPEGKCVLITGGTGGLGAHLVAEAALRTDVTRVVCLNRPGKHQAPRERQMQALHKKGLDLPAHAAAKIHVLEATDMAQSPTLGLSGEEYGFLLQHVTHVVHNAWLMHSKWPVKRFEPQLRIVAHMLALAAAISAQRPHNCPVTFQFISSIATVGHHPLSTGKPVVPEDRVPIDSVLPTGYGDAKYICERMLDATLHRHADRFRATAVRLGQIAGSAVNGHWNPMEHVPFLFRSSLTLGFLPDLPGTMGWTPADDMAQGLLEILLQPDEVALYPVYHIENPVRQPWAETLAVLADEMGIPSANIIPFPEWVQRVRHWPRREDNGSQGANPAYLLVDFLDSNFIRMSCGGLLMGTAKAREHSPTLAKLGPVNESLIRQYVRSWREMGFLG